MRQNSVNENFPNYNRAPLAYNTYNKSSIYAKYLRRMS